MLYAYLDEHWENGLRNLLNWKYVSGQKERYIRFCCQKKKANHIAGVKAWVNLDGGQAEAQSSKIELQRIIRTKVTWVLYLWVFDDVVCIWVLGRSLVRQANKAGPKFPLMENKIRKSQR